MSKILRGLRGATTARPTPGQAIWRRRPSCLRGLQEANGFQPEDVESAIFTSSPDLTTEYPARAARLLGWSDVPLLGGRRRGSRRRTALPSASCSTSTRPSRSAN